MVKSSGGYVGINGKIISIWGGKFAKSETWAFGVSEVGKSSMLFGFKSYCGKWPRNQWRVE